MPPSGAPDSSIIFINSFKAGLAPVLQGYRTSRGTLVPDATYPPAEAIG